MTTITELALRLSVKHAFHLAIRHHQGWIVQL